MTRTPDYDFPASVPREGKRSAISERLSDWCLMGRAYDRTIVVVSYNVVDEYAV